MEHQEADLGELQKQFNSWKEQVGREDELLLQAEEEEVGHGETRTGSERKASATISSDIDSNPGIRREGLIEDYSFQKAKEKGNNLFRKGELQSALKSYDMAISLAKTGEDKATAFSNRSLVKLKLGDGYGAFNDAEMGLDSDFSTDEMRRKLRLRSAQALKMVSETVYYKVRELGNEAFKNMDLKRSITLYTSSYFLAQKEDDTLGIATVLCNRSLAYFKSGEYGKAERDAVDVLAMDAQSPWLTTKAMYRKAMAILKQGRQAEGVMLLEQLVQLGRAPVDKEALKELNSLRRNPEHPTKVPVSTAATSILVPSESPSDNVPETFYQLERLWRNLRSAQGTERKINFLKSIPLKNYERLFGDSLSADFVHDFAQILNCLTTEEDKFWGKTALTALKKVRRFDLILMLCSSETEKNIEMFERS